MLTFTSFFNFPVTPSQYTNGYFTTSAQQVGTSKQYKCVVSKNPNSPISRGTAENIKIILEAIEQSNERRVDYATITVNVAAVNQNPPTITTNSNTGYIYENSPRYSQVSANPGLTALLKLTFSDPDAVSLSMSLST